MKRLPDLCRAYERGEPFSMVTAYDAPQARLVDASPVDCILVGDSVAMVVHGFDSTVHATVEMMAMHTAAVRRGTDKLVVADMPFPVHRQGIDPAMRAVDTLMKAGATAIKIEGARGHLETVRHIVDSGVPVMGHLGLTPQSVHAIGGYRVQGRAEAEAERMRAEALALQEAGAFALVLELVPAQLAAEVTESLAVPTIGIGSGNQTSGQVLVFHDALGLSPGFKPKFLRTFARGADALAEGLAAYAKAVRGREFPNDSESF